MGVTVENTFMGGCTFLEYSYGWGVGVCDCLKHIYEWVYLSKFMDECDCLEDFYGWV